MKMESMDLVREFYRSVRERYPDLTLAQCKEAVLAPWAFMKGEMESGGLSAVRFRYLGVFRVYEGRARHMLAELGPRLDKGLVPRAKHDRARAALEWFLENGELRMEN